MLSITPIPAFSDNYIWAIHNSTGCYVVDPGEPDAVLQFIAETGLTLAGILITHHHFDHTGGIKSLTAENSIPVYGPDNQKIDGITRQVKNGDNITILGCSFSILATPGHTLDHIVYFSNNNSNPILFCGDTLFSGGCGRLFEGTPEQMQQSLDKLADLPENTQVFCAHEYTRANLAFAATIEPENTDIQARISDVDQLRQQNRPSIPTSIGLEKKQILF